MDIGLFLQIRTQDIFRMRRSSGLLISNDQFRLYRRNGIRRRIFLSNFTCFFMLFKDGRTLRHNIFKRRRLLLRTLRRNKDHRFTRRGFPMSLNNFTRNLQRNNGTILCAR